MLQEAQMTDDKEKIVIPKSKESNDAMLTYLVNMVRQEPGYKKTESVSKRLKFSFFYVPLWMLSSMVMFFSVMNIPSSSAKDLIVGGFMALFTGAIISLFVSGAAFAIAIETYDKEKIERKLIKKFLLENYGIDFKQEFLDTKEGLAKVITMMEDLSNNTFTEPRLSGQNNKAIRTERGNVVRNFAQAMLLDVKSWGVSKDNIDYHVNLAIYTFISGFRKHEHRLQVQEKNKHLELEMLHC